MNMKKKVLSLGLASVVLLGMIGCTDNSEKDKDLTSPGSENVENTDKAEDIEKDDINVSDESEEESNYINHKGKITEVNNEDGVMSIVVDEKEPLNDSEKAPSSSAIKFNLADDIVILDSETQEPMKADTLKEGMVVEVAYDKDSAMTKSLPPMTNASVVLVRTVAEQEGKGLGVKVDRFDKDQISIDNSLKYNITEETVIVDRAGEKLTKEDLADKDLVVFYGPEATASIPAQSNAVKIIALD